MSKFVAYEKLSKKKKRAIDQVRRGTWGEMNPASRKVESEKIYNRKKCRRMDWDSSAGVLICMVG